MDVHCNRCREPWDVYHLRHDAIWDAVDDIGEKACESFNGKLTPKIRKAMQDQGWEFGSTTMNVKRCPCCEEGDTLDADRSALADAAEDVLGDDIDGIASTLEDFGG